MKRIRPSTSILGLAFILGVLAASGRSQPAQPQLYLMGDFQVETSRVGEYEAALKELLASLGKHGFSFRLDTYSTDDSHFYMVYPLKNYADADLWYKEWGEFTGKIGPENLRALDGRIVACEKI